MTTDQVVVEIAREKILSRKSALFWEVPTILQKNISKESERENRAAGDMEKRLTERTHWECFRCGSEDHLIEKCLNPPKENEKMQN